MGQSKLLPLQIRVTLVVVAIKGCSKLSNSLELEAHHQIQFSVINRIPLFYRHVLHYCRDTVSAPPTKVHIDLLHKKCKYICTLKLGFGQLVDWVYAISTLVGYLMPNLAYTYIKYIQFVGNIFKRVRAYLSAYS